MTPLIQKTLELTVPEHRLIDQLDSPISIVTYDAETAPSLLQQYDYPNIEQEDFEKGVEQIDYKSK